MNSATYYHQLEMGARFLAVEASDAAERREHLGWANRYARLRLDAVEAEQADLQLSAA